MVGVPKEAGKRATARPSPPAGGEILPTASCPEPGHARVEGDGDGSPDMEATKGDYAVPKLRQMRV